MQAETVTATRRRTVWNVLRRNLFAHRRVLDPALRGVHGAVFRGSSQVNPPQTRTSRPCWPRPRQSISRGTPTGRGGIFSPASSGAPGMTLVISLAAASIPFVVGTLIGLFTALFRRHSGHAFMRLVDVMMSFPVIVLIIAIIGGAAGPGIGNMYLAMAGGMDELRAPWCAAPSWWKKR